MMKGDKRNVRLVAVYILIFILMGVFMPRELDWKPSFSMYHNMPYGAEAVHDNLKDLFDSEAFFIAEEPLYNLLKDTIYSNSNYIYIDSNFYLDSLDQVSLYSFAEEGNNVFISAENFDYGFLDSLGIGLETHLNNIANVKELDGGTSLLGILNADSLYEFKAQWVNTYFVKLDSSETLPTGIGWQDSLYNFIKVPYGNGNFFLHSFPYALTNYYLMKEENRDYISAVFSQLPSEYDVIWDEYYKPYRASVRPSTLSVLMRYASFRWVYWLTMTGVFLFMIFYAKRKQRPIPIINAPNNDSLNFIKTLGSLYYNKGNNKDILDKKVRVFKEYLNAQYFMKDISFTDEEADRLIRKSGADQKVVGRIFNLGMEYERLAEISDAQLKALVKKINEFYNYTKAIK